jgi:hypothetical protein
MASAYEMINAIGWRTILYIFSLIVLFIVLLTRYRNLKIKRPFDPTDEEIIDVLKKIEQCSSSSNKPFTRSLDDERVFMEDLLIKRINFLIIVFSIFFAASNNIKDEFNKSIVLMVGFFFCNWLGIIAKRAHYKHHWIMRVLYGIKDRSNDKGETDNLWEFHPVKIINDAMSSNIARKNITKGSVSLLVGYLIPNLTSYILLITALYSFSCIEFKDKDKLAIDSKVTVVEIQDHHTKANKGFTHARNTEYILIIDDTLRFHRYLK